MAFKFVADRILADKGYPALAQWQARPYTPEWRQFIQHWPYTIPVDLHEHCRAHAFPSTISTVRDPHDLESFYTIAIGWFDFTIDYFALLSVDVTTALKQSTLRILFYYDEGDNPCLIKQRLDQLCVAHNLTTDCYRFISANTAAEQIDNFVYLPCDELLYWHRNRAVAPIGLTQQPRPYDFTLLSRTHKWWRATVVADLRSRGLLDRSMWSYNTIDVGDCEEDNPIEIDSFGALRQDVYAFLAGAPYTCDNLTADQHNDHHLTESAHYTDSYFNIVLETHFDADGSGGAFLTEKTFKPIKHAQPFVIVGAPGSLQALRDLGYRTFDHAVDTSYDTIQDNTQRWRAVRSVIEQIKQDPASYFAQCQDDVVHNQQLFLSSKYDRLNSLLERLQK